MGCFASPFAIMYFNEIPLKSDKICYITALFLGIATDHFSSLAAFIIPSDTIKPNPQEETSSFQLDAIQVLFRKFVLSSAIGLYPQVLEGNQELGSSPRCFGRWLYCSDNWVGDFPSLTLGFLLHS